MKTYSIVELIWIISSGVLTLLILFSLFGCIHMPDPPVGSIVIMDKAIDRASWYLVPNDVDGQFKWERDATIQEAFDQERTHEYYCISPGYFIDIKNYAKQAKRYVEQYCK